MLKLPMGCADDSTGNRARPSAAIAARKERTGRALTGTGGLWLASNDIPLRQPVQRLGCHFGIENVEVRIGFKCPSQIVSRLCRIPSFFVDHSRVKEQLCVFRTLPKSVRDGL